MKQSLRPKRASRSSRNSGADEVVYRLGGGGTASGSSTFKFEAPSQAEMGKLLDRMMGDSDYQTFMTKINAEKAPSVLGQILGFSVLDLGLPAGTPGRVGTLVAWQPRPGRVEDAIALAVESANALLRLGASRCRVVQVTTGENIPAFVSSTESASFTAQGAWRDALATDKEWQGIAARLSGEGRARHLPALHGVVHPGLIDQTCVGTVDERVPTIGFSPGSETTATNRGQVYSTDRR